MSAPNDLYEVRLHCQKGDQASVNVLHYNVAGIAGVGASDAEIASAMDIIFAANLKACLNGNANYRGVTIQKIAPTMTVAVSSTALAGVGAGTGDCLPKQTSGLIAKRTALAGPSNRGRMYVPFPSENDNDEDGLPNAGYQSALDDLAASVASGVIAGALPNTTSMTPVLLHRDSGFFSQITSAVKRPFWATQRRRGSYGRPNLPPI